MKRALRVLGESSDRDAVPPVKLSMGGRIISVADAHDGREAARFAGYLKDLGAVLAKQGAKPSVRIVIRSTPESPEARIRAAVLEESADLVLGSPRLAVARQLAQPIAGVSTAQN